MSARDAMRLEATIGRDLPVTVLAIDPGETSGWAHNGTGTWETGTATTWRERYDAVADVWSLEGRDRPLVVVAETWPGLRGQALAGLGAQWGRWLAELERLEVPPRRIVRVDTGTWGQAILGRSRLTTEQRRAASMMRARAVLGYDVTHDEAAALCIGLWGLRSEKVARAIGKRELARLGWSEA